MPPRGPVRLGPLPGRKRRVRQRPDSPRPVSCPRASTTRSAGKVVTIPLAPRTARSIDLVAGERTDGPVFLAGDGRRLDRHGAGWIVRKVARRAGITTAVTPHTLRHAFITAGLDAGVPLRDVQEAASHADQRTTMRYDRAHGSLDRHATYIVAPYIAGAAR
jgi:integrase/recombinase XerD